ncbi:MAG: Asp23/Gls24 family envelope stress response protein [Humibacillus sp.]|nr:Asp23/Gls24 family envelope stress response protein [Humibacillus sp.]MDN5776649.1 Asp23/Gls24 family envelope stress response protein [Humibacillus sp.]
MALTDTGRLGCGRDVDDVWAHIGDEPDEHEATCPDCQAARADLAGLASATTAMVDSDRDDARLVNQPSALAAIVAIARTEVRRGRTLPLTLPPRQPSDLPADRPPVSETGELTISEQAVASIIRQASDRVADVEARRCRVSVVDDEPRSTATEAGSPTRFSVELSLTVGRAVRIPGLATQLRRAITTAIDDRIGVGVASIDIHVEDLHDA